MPNKCCVTGCRSNYEKAEGYVLIFKFPCDENLRKLWLKKIPRKNWTPGPQAVVCEVHFDEKFISKIEEYIDKDGQKKTFPRKRPVLSSNAVPTIFPNLPQYLSSSSGAERTNPEKRRKLVLEHHEKAVDEFLSSDIILNFEKLLGSYTKYVNSLKWKFEINDTFVAYLTDLTEFPRIPVCIKIDSNLQVLVYQNGYRVPPSDLSWLGLIGYNCQLTRWSHFENLLNRYA